jgi:hypothetical protein
MSMPVLDGNFEAFVTNLGKYNEENWLVNG